MKSLTIVLSIVIIALGVAEGGKVEVKERSEEPEQLRRHCRHLECPGKQEIKFNSLNQCFCGCLDSKYMQSCTSLSVYWDPVDCICRKQTINQEFSDISGSLLSMIMPLISSMMGSFIGGSSNSTTTTVAP